MFYSELVHVSAYLNYVENRIFLYASVCFFMLLVSMNLYIHVYALERLEICPKKDILYPRLTEKLLDKNTERKKAYG
jgi:hypothetical protein